MSAQEVRAEQETSGGHQQEAAGLCSGVTSHIAAHNQHGNLRVSFWFCLLIVVNAEKHPNCSAFTCLIWRRRDTHVLYGAPVPSSGYYSHCRAT